VGGELVGGVGFLSLIGILWSVGFEEKGVKKKLKGGGSEKFLGVEEGGSSLVSILGKRGTRWGGKEGSTGRPGGFGKRLKNNHSRGSPFWVVNTCSAKPKTWVKKLKADDCAAQKEKGPYKEPIKTFIESKEREGSRDEDTDCGRKKEGLESGHLEGKTQFQLINLLPGERGLIEGVAGGGSNSTNGTEYAFHTEQEKKGGRGGKINMEG